jgi:hypothetical protein
MATVNPFTARFKVQYCNSNCITQALDEPNFPVAILPHVADVCAIKNSFRVGAILPTLDGHGNYLRVVFVLCDLVGIPVAYLKYIGENWYFSLANKREIKERGFDRTEISSVKPQYIIKTIKKYHKVFTDKMPKVADFVGQVGMMGETALDAILNGTYIATTASINVDAMVAAMQALESGKDFNTIAPEHQRNLRETYEYSQRNTRTRDTVATFFKENIIDKEFYAIAQLTDNYTKCIIVTKVKADSRLADRHKFTNTTCGSRFTQVGGVHVFRSFEHMKEAMPQMGNDIDFQAEMMRQALHAFPDTLTLDKEDKLLGISNDAKYYKELNIIRRPLNHREFLQGTLTMMEAL